MCEVDEAGGDGPRRLAGRRRVAALLASMTAVLAPMPILLDVPGSDRARQIGVACVIVGALATALAAGLALRRTQGNRPRP